MTMVITEIESRRDRKKAAVRARIIATAIDLFGRHGLANVTVEHIADVADIGKGTIYNYFETKEDIVVAFMVDLEQKVQARIKKFTASRASLDSILTNLVLLEFKLKKPYHQFVRVFLGQLFSRTEHFLPYMIEMQKAIDPVLDTLFRALQEHRVIRQDVNIPELTIAFKTLHLGITGLWAVEGPPFQQTEKTLRLQMKLFAQGLEAKRH
jgi:AcrR family transcriptional regulator